MEQKTKYLYLKKETNWEVGSFWLFFRKFRRDRNLNKLYDAIFHHHIYQLLNSMLYFEGMEVHGRKSSSEMWKGIQVSGNFIHLWCVLSPPLNLLFNLEKYPARSRKRINSRYVYCLYIYITLVDANIES